MSARPVGERAQLRSGYGRTVPLRIGGRVLSWTGTRSLRWDSTLASGRAKRSTNASRESPRNDLRHNPPVTPSRPRLRPREVL